MKEKQHHQLHASVTGRVQGVGFRYFVYSNAARLGLTGWVRNRRDGSVEVLAEGTRDNLETLLSALQLGPRPNTARKLRTTWSSASGEFTRFRIRETL
jgi:acylphosphatase